MPDDIFSPQPIPAGAPSQVSAPPTPKSQPQITPESVQDIFSDTEPQVREADAVQTVPAASTYNPYATPIIHSGSNKKVMILIIAGIVVVAAIVSIILLVMNMTKVPAANNTQPQAQPQGNQAPVNQPTQPTSNPEPIQTNEGVPSSDSQEVPATPDTTQPAVVDPSTTDQDEDGLTDAQEATLGTNLYLPDTDNDMLSDRQEADVYHTDPLNADTDGDGYLDGSEVQNGYDPKGPGRLLVLPQN